jgi:DNA-binding transcriptional MerR regulator
MAEGQAERQSWKEWISPENYPAETDLLTRKEVIARAHDLNVRRHDGREVDVRAMRYWEELGIIPQGEPSESGYHQNLYPWWVVDMLYQVCRYQEAGVDLDQLPDLMREEAQRLSRDRWPRQKQPVAVHKGEPQTLSDLLYPEWGERLREPTQPPFRRPPDAVYARAVERLVDLLNAIAPGNGLAAVPRDMPTRVRIEYIGQQGQTVRLYDLPLDDPDAALALIEEDKRIERAEQTALIDDLLRGSNQTSAEE